jgi:hypothetical protein
VQHERTIYEVRSGRHIVCRLDASTPRQALNEYLRGLGCRDDEMRCVAPNAVAWRGGVFTADPAPTVGDLTQKAA